MQGYKIIFCCLLLFAFTAHTTFAQQPHKDTAADNLKSYHFRYFRLPGQPDSATFFKRMDSLDQRKRVRDVLFKKYDSLRKLRNVL